MAQRPNTQARQGTSGGRLGTAQRLTPSSQRPGAAVFAKTVDAERPMTRGGLGRRTAGTGGKHRAVMDKSYYLGALRLRTAELGTETRRLAAESDRMRQEHGAFVLYDSRATEMARELSEIQAELADYNTLVEIMNMDSEKRAVDEQVAELCENNAQDSSVADALYMARKQKEEDIARIEREVEKEEAVIDKIFSGMSSEMAKKYELLKSKASKVEIMLQDISKQIDEEDLKSRKLMEIINASPMKTEAYALFSKLEELESKKAELLEEVARQETPDEERERLMREVKDNNDAIEAMERRKLELYEAVSRANDELEELDSEDSDVIKKQRARQKSLHTEDLMSQIAESKTEEERKVLRIEVDIARLLHKISSNLRTLESLRPADRGLTNHKEWEKVNDIERQIISEMKTLKHSMQTMKEDAAKFSDLDMLKNEAQVRRANLHVELVEISEKCKTAKAECKSVELQKEEIESSLLADETYIELQALERKLAALEGSNFAMQEAIADMRALGEYRVIRDKVLAVSSEINKKLINLIKTRKIPT